MAAASQVVDKVPRFTSGVAAAAVANKLLTSISIRKKFPTKVISANLAPDFVSKTRRWPESYASVPS